MELEDGGREAVRKEDEKIKTRFLFNKWKPKRYYQKLLSQELEMHV